MNGVTIMVLLLSLSLGSALEAITAGTVQPKPNSIGKKAFPDKPAIPIVSFIT